MVLFNGKLQRKNIILWNPLQMALVRLMQKKSSSPLVFCCCCYTVVVVVVIVIKVRFGAHNVCWYLSNSGANTTCQGRSSEGDCSVRSSSPTKEQGAWVSVPMCL